MKPNFWFHTTLSYFLWNQTRGGDSKHRKWSLLKKRGHFFPLIILVRLNNWVQKDASSNADFLHVYCRPAAICSQDASLVVCCRVVAEMWGDRIGLCHHCLHYWYEWVEWSLEGEMEEREHCATKKKKPKKNPVLFEPTLNLGQFPWVSHQETQITRKDGLQFSPQRGRVKWIRLDFRVFICNMSTLLVSIVIN